MLAKLKQLELKKLNALKELKEIEIKELEALKKQGAADQEIENLIKLKNFKVLKVLQLHTFNEAQHKELQKNIIQDFRDRAYQEWQKTPQDGIERWQKMAINSMQLQEIPTNKPDSTDDQETRHEGFDSDRQQETRHEGFDLDMEGLGSDSHTDFHN